MNTETMKEMAVKAKDWTAKFAYDHREEIAALAGFSASAFLGLAFGYELGRVRSMSALIYNEQLIRYTEAMTAPDVKIYTDVPKEVK